MPSRGIRRAAVVAVLLAVLAGAFLLGPRLLSPPDDPVMAGGQATATRPTAGSPPTLRGTAPPERGDAGDAADAGGEDSAAVTDRTALRVLVVSDEDGAPVPSAEVQVLGTLQREGRVLARGTTDAAGAARFADVWDVGGVTLVVSAPGFGRQVAAAETVRGEETEASVRLPRGVAFGGQVVDLLDDLPLANATVHLASAGFDTGTWLWFVGEIVAATRTGRDGQFRFEGCAAKPGNRWQFELHLLIAAHQGHATRALLVVDPAPLTRPGVRISLPRAGRVVGRVRAGSQPSPPGAQVVLVPAGDRLTYERERTGWAYGRGAPADLVGTRRGTADFEAAFPDPSLLDPAPLADLWLFREVEVSRDGRFEFACLGSGERWDAVAKADGWAPSPPVTAVAAPDPVPVTLDLLARTGRVRVHLRDPEGAPVAGMEVQACEPGDADYGESGSRSWSGPDGIAILSDIPPGRVRVVASPHGTHDVAEGDLPDGGVVDIDLEVQRVAPPEAPTPADVGPAPEAWARLTIDLPPGSDPPGSVGVRVLPGSETTETWPDGEGRRHPMTVPVPAGPVLVEIRAGDFLPVMLRVSLRSGETADLPPVVLDSGLDLHGRVVDERDRPAPKLDVWVQQVDPRYGDDDVWKPGLVVRAASTAADGSFHLQHLRAGPATVFVQYPPEQIQSLEMEIGPDTAPIEIRIPAFVVVDGRVVDREGNPVAHVSVQVEDPTVEGDARWVAWATTDRTGRFRIASRSGHYRILVCEWWADRAGDSPLASEDLTLTAGVDRSLVLVVPR